MVSEEQLQKYTDMFEAEGEPVYNKEKTQTYFRFGLIFVALTGIIINQKLTGEPGSLQAHFQTAVVAVFAVKAWYTTPDFMDAAEESGLVYSIEDKEDEKEDE